MRVEPAQHCRGGAREAGQAGHWAAARQTGEDSADNGWEAGRDTGIRNTENSHRKGTGSLVDTEGNTEMIIKGRKTWVPIPRMMP